MSDSKPKWAHVFCLEGMWDAAFDDRQSVRPLLDFLDHSNLISYIHRDVATRQELNWHLARWIENDTRHYTLYLAFHGSPNCLCLSEHESVTLGELGSQLEQELGDCVVYFGACSVVRRRNDRIIRNFLAQTGARAAIGYTTDVEWLESAAMDLFVLGHLAWYQRLAQALDALEADIGSRALRRQLGLQIIRA